MARNVREDFKFRITCKISLAAQPKDSEFEFRYTSLAQARKNYKAILLGLYRKKDVLGFCICLNRCNDSRWTKAIFEERVGHSNN
jgi:hypothetical protein